MTTRRLTTAAAIVEFLKQQYVERDGKAHRLINGIGGIFGHGNVAGLGAALEERGGKDLPYYQPKNEQAMVHAAVAFAKARRGLGTLACTSSIGPGATNMVTGAATATVNRLPVLLLPGDIFANRMPDPVLQQLENPHSQDLSVNDCFKPVSRYWDRINRPEQILRAFPEAMRVLADPATAGAVTIALPQDVQAEAFDFPASFFARRVYRIARRPCLESEIAEAVSLIREARRPFIVAGGGVYYSEAEASLAEFAQATGIPVGVTQAGKTALPARHGSCLGALGVTGTQAANRLAAKADLVLCLGTRLSDFTTASKTQFQAPDVRFVSVNVNGFDGHKHGALALIGDVDAVTKQLGRTLAGHRVSDDYAREIAAAREEWQGLRRTIVAPPARADLPSQAEVIGVMNELAGPGVTVVHAAGGIPGDIHKLWDPVDPQDYHAEYGYSCMGYEIAGALGVKMACPDREVFAFLGDGSYLMLNHEIVTSIQEGLKITVVLVENGGFRCIQNLQRACGGKSFGNEFKRRSPESMRLDHEPVAVDYVENARSLGAAAFGATTVDEFRSALERARRETRTSLVCVRVDPTKGIPGFSWWDVAVSEESRHPSVDEASRGYREAKKKQRYYDSVVPEKTATKGN